MLRMESKAGQSLLVGQHVSRACKETPVLSFRKLRALGSAGNLSFQRKVWRVSNHWLEPLEHILAAKALV